jgi:leader peptidase (prepilin peptidase)/N-methyltransferase
VPFAFGPFLAIAMWIWLVAGDPILAAYLQLVGAR